MKNIILQHWTGELDELGQLSSANIQKYASKCGAKYKLLRGNVFRSFLSPPCQKIFMLDASFDDYDTVVMLDMDMFTRKGMEDNIFDPSITGIGMRTTFQEALFKSLCEHVPDLTDPQYPYWGGAIYKLDRKTRQELRSHIDDNELKRFHKNFEDEGIMHRLATLAKIEKCKLPDDRKWCHGSFEDGIDQAALIHIRTKVTPIGPKRPKIENYRDLVSRGLIEE